MALLFSPDNISSGYQSTAALQQNFAALQTALARGLSRFGDSPNGMHTTLDMQGYRIFNLPNAASNGEPVTYQQWAGQMNPVEFTGYLQEIQTATDGQTVFNLANSYTPGLGALRIFVNGLHYPSAEYVETDTNTVTFTHSLVAGDQVAFIITSFTEANYDTAATVTYTPAGTGALTINVQDKLRESVSVRDFGADPTGAADSTAAIQAAINASPGSVYIPAGTYSVTGLLTCGSNKRIDGDGESASVIQYTGTGTCITFVSPSGTGVRIYNGGMSRLQISTSTGAIGVDADSLSEADFSEVIVNGFSVAGFRLRSSTSGGAVYNRFYSVKAQSCGTGFDLIRDGSGTSSYTNDNVFVACRANICTTGFNISGGNHNVIHASQIEVCTTGVALVEPATATANQNVMSLCRFESNTTDVNIGSGVVDSHLDNNWYVNGDRITDAGTRTNISGAGPAQQRLVSAFQIPGGSFRFVRTASGGSEIPHTVFKEDASTNSPVTIEVQSAAASLDARALRVRYGAGDGPVKFGVVPISGKITDLSTTNGPVGAFTMGAAATTVVSNTAVAADSRIFLQPANPAACTLFSGKGVYISARVAGTSFTAAVGDATSAVGTEIFWYWLVN